jgi:hypothetical protein
MRNSEKITSSDTLLKLYHEKIAEVLALKELNERLLDASNNLLIRNIDFSRKNNLSVDPETKSLIAEVRSILHQMQSPTNLNNQNKHPDNEHNHNCGSNPSFSNLLISTSTSFSHCRSMMR